MEQEAEMEEEDVLPPMEVSGGKQGLVDERLRALLMLLNQVRVENTFDSKMFATTYNNFHTDAIQLERITLTRNSIERWTIVSP